MRKPFFVMSVQQYMHDGSDGSVEQDEDDEKEQIAVTTSLPVHNYKHMKSWFALAPGDSSLCEGVECFSDDKCAKENIGVCQQYPTLWEKVAADLEQFALLQTSSPVAVTGQCNIDDSKMQGYVSCDENDETVAEEQQRDKLDCVDQQQTNSIVYCTEYSTPAEIAEIVRRSPESLTELSVVALQVLKHDEYGCKQEVRMSKNIIYADHTRIIGDRNVIFGNFNMIIGEGNKSKGNNNRSRGKNNMSEGKACTNHDTGFLGYARGAGSVRISIPRHAASNFRLTMSATKPRTENHNDDDNNNAVTNSAKQAEVSLF